MKGYVLIEFKKISDWLREWRALLLPLWCVKRGISSIRTHPYLGVGYTTSITHF
jgi:hypothetical protein